MPFLPWNDFGYNLDIPSMVSMVSNVKVLTVLLPNQVKTKQDKRILIKLTFLFYCSDQLWSDSELINSKNEAKCFYVCFRLICLYYSHPQGKGTYIHKCIWKISHSWVITFWTRALHPGISYKTETTLMWSMYSMIVKTVSFETA